jgi:hypothetical protein
MIHVNPRDSVFWQGAFLRAYGELLRRSAPSDKVLPGARIAALACNMADDCERARTSDGAACAQCNGVGCEDCMFTGKAEPGDGLHAPTVARSLSLVGRPPPPEGAPPIASSLDALSRAIGQADRDTEEKRNERFGGGGGEGAGPES